MARIEITISVESYEIARTSEYKRREILGRMASEALLDIAPLPTAVGFSANRKGSWVGAYTEENLKKAFRDWARDHDGLAPYKRDWTSARDPEHRWPRVDAVEEAARRIAPSYGVRVTRWAPHDDEARRAYLLVEAGHNLIRAGEDDHGLSETPYCAECRHGSGCMEAEMSPWCFAVEVLGELVVRTGGGHHARRSRAREHGRNRRTVTGGAADVRPERSDPAASAIIETIDR